MTKRSQQAVSSTLSAVTQALSRYTKAAVDLHLQYLSHSGNGVETHTVLVTDIPGASAGGNLLLASTVASNA